MKEMLKEIQSFGRIVEKHWNAESQYLFVTFESALNAAAAVLSS